MDNDELDEEVSKLDDALLEDEVIKGEVEEEEEDKEEEASAWGSD